MSLFLIIPIKMSKVLFSALLRYNCQNMNTIHQAGETRLVQKFVIFAKIKDRWTFLFSFVRVEQVYEGNKWLFNRFITDDSVLSKELETEIKRARGN